MFALLSGFFSNLKIFNYLGDILGKCKYYLILLVVIILLILCLYIQNGRKIKEINSLTTQNQALELKTKTQESTIKGMLAQANRLQEANTNLQKNRAKLEEETSKLNKLLASHDLKNLAFQKPTLIEKKANAATKKLFTEFEQITNPLGF